MSQETLAPKIRVFPIPDASPAVARPTSGDRFFHFSLMGIGLLFLGVSLAGLPFARIVVPLAPLAPRAFLFGLLFIWTFATLPELKNTGPSAVNR